MNIFLNNNSLRILDHLHFQDIKLRKSAQINNLNRIALHSDYLNKIPPVSDLTNLYVLNVGNLFIPVDMNVKNVNGENFDGFLSSLVKKDMHTQIPGSVLLEGVSISISSERFIYAPSYRIYTPPMFPP